jgi:hypothetical protein
MRFFLVFHSLSSLFPMKAEDGGYAVVEPMIKVG